MRDEGRTTVALGLARAFAAGGRKVLLVDADVREPQIAERTHVRAAPGLADVLRGHDLIDALQGREQESLTVLPAGAVDENTPDQLRSPAAAALLEHLAGRFEIVVFDTPPLLAVSDALALGAHVSGVVLVARIDSTPHRALRRAVRILGDAGANLFGPLAVDAPDDTAQAMPFELSLGARQRDVALTGAAGDEPGATP
jgi:capsular exopolysaccharide synthesis family protein